MERATPTNKQFEIIESQIRECYGRVVYTHKTHEKCCDRYHRLNHRLKMIQIVLAALASTSALITLIGDGKITTVVTTLLTLTLLVINMYLKDYDLGTIAQKHSSAASELWSIRESYLSLLTDLKAKTISIGVASQKRDELQGALTQVYGGSPRTDGQSYAEASKALKENEEMTFSDKEIDAFLPIHLRKLTA